MNGWCRKPLTVEQKRYIGSILFYQKFLLTAGSVPSVSEDFAENVNLSVCVESRANSGSSVEIKQTVLFVFNHLTTM